MPVDVKRVIRIEPAHLVCSVQHAEGAQMCGCAALPRDLLRGRGEIRVPIPQLEGSIGQHRSSPTWCSATSAPIQYRDVAA